MTEPIRIREYAPADKPAVMELLRLNTPRYFAPAEAEELASYLDTERELYFVVLAGEQIVGCGGINFADDGTTGRISWDIFHPQYQGRALGSRLLAYRIGRLRALGHVRRITVRTSQLACGFYGKRGFVLQEVRRNFWAPGFDMYRMEYTGPLGTDE